MALFSTLLRFPCSMSLFLLLLLLSELAVMTVGFEFVPVLAFLAVKDPLGAKDSSTRLCNGIGGYLATEPTSATHEAVVAAAQAAGGGAEWYAYLGADTRDPTRNDCPNPLFETLHKSGATLSCYWRWNQGRWLDLPDNASLRLYTPSIGVTFFVGNYFLLDSPDMGVTGGFVTYFANTTTTSAKTDCRPNCLMGRDLVAVGSAKGSTWSDNLEAGGYTYAGYNYEDVVSQCGWDTLAKGATKDRFLAICEIQVPTRIASEIEEHEHSVIREWWVPYFVFLFVACLICFIIVWRCQDREDADEPLDRVPEWVEKEAEGLIRTKSFVSQRAIECQDENRPVLLSQRASARWNASQRSLGSLRAASMRNVAEFTHVEAAIVPNFTNVTPFERRINPSHESRAMAK